MAFIAPIAGIFSGGGLLAGLGKAVLGLGINLAIAHFFPQKVKGPRAESLKAQTSRYGDRLARIYGTARTAGAITWLKGNQVDEHVRTYRQGKALGPEVTEYSYTATFAVAFVWNGPVAAIPRIWADDKLIYDASAESLQDAIDTGGSAIGVAEGATVTVYLGTDGQGPDPDIEADVGAGNAPSWPGRTYVVIKNLPLEEFGIRVPNIEAEVIHAGTETTTSVEPTTYGVNAWRTDTYGNFFVNAEGTSLTIQRLPGCSIIATHTLPFNAFAVHITERNKVIVTYANERGCRIFDAETGAFEQDLDFGPDNPILNASIDDISIAGINYVFIKAATTAVCLSTSGSGYSMLWEANDLTQSRTLSASPEWLYGTTDMVFDLSKNVIVHHWNTGGIVASATVTLATTGNIRAVFYDQESDSVVVQDATGSLYVYTPDLSTLLRSVSNSFAGGLPFNDPLLSKRMKLGSDRIGVKELTGNDIYIYRLSDLSLISRIDAESTDWANVIGSNDYFNVGFSQSWNAALVLGTGEISTIWYLPRAQRGAEPLADIIEAECRLAGMVADVSAVTGEVKGYPDREGSAPRGVIEDLCRINSVDWAQVDGVQTFFMRKTAADRTLTVAETGMTLNAEPDPVQVKEEYPDPKDIPEQVIISYMSWDAEYRIGSQAGNPEEDANLPDEPTEADETGYPVKVRKKRPLGISTAQVLTDQEAARAADIIFNDLRDSATKYRTSVGPKHLDLHPGNVVNLPLDDSRTAKAVIEKMAGETVLEMEFRKRGDSFTSEAVAQPTPYVVDTLLGIAAVAPVLIDGHLLRSADNNDGFYAGVAVTGDGQFRSATLFQSEDSGTTYNQWAAFVNGMIRGIAVDALPDRAHPGAWDRATSFTIAVPQGTAPDSVSEASLLASETSNGFAVWNASVGDWEYIRAASVVDNLDGTWTLSTLLRGQKGTEFAMAGHAAGATVYHLDSQAMDRATDGDRTLPRVYVAVASGTAFNSTGAVAFTNSGKGLRCWAPCGLKVERDGSGNITGTFHRRDRLGQEWPESGAEDPPMSETVESYKVYVYDTGVVVRTIPSATESFSYSAADQTTDFGSPQSSIDFGIVQVSATYGDGIELSEAA